MAVERRSAFAQPLKAEANREVVAPPAIPREPTAALPPYRPPIQWQFILTDKDYVPQGEILNAYERKVSKPLSKLDNASFRVRLDNPFSNQLMECNGYIKAYRNKKLMFFGPTISAELAADDGGAAIVVNAISPGWYFTKRLAGAQPEGTIYSTLTDRAHIFRAEMQEGGEWPEDHGVRADASRLSSGSAITYTAGPYRTVMDTLNELSNSYDGFEWMIEPVENWSAQNGILSWQTGMFVAAPRPLGFGTQRHEAIFEYGMGQNTVKSFKRTITRDSQVNRIYHVAQGLPIINEDDDPSYHKYKLLSEVAQIELTDETLRRQFLKENLRIRANPRQIVEFQPHVDPNTAGLPQFGVDYGLGDRVTFRAAQGDRLLLDTQLRIWGISFEINEHGTETGSLALAEEQ